MDPTTNPDVETPPHIVPRSLIAPKINPLPGKMMVSSSPMMFMRNGDQLDYHGERVIEGFKEISSLVVVISTVGAGFMFSSILGEIKPPASTFGVDRVRLFLVLSWGSFMLALGLASFLTLLLIFNSIEVAGQWGKGNKWPVATFIVCLVMLTSIVVAGIFLLCIILAYEFWVGIVGFSVGAVVFGGSVYLGFVQLSRELARWYYRDQQPTAGE